MRVSSPKRASVIRLPPSFGSARRLLYVHGRIDRIEIAGQKAIIRDLKTARAHPRIGKEAKPSPGLDVQIAVYGLIAELLATRMEAATANRSWLCLFWPTERRALLWRRLSDRSEARRE